LSNKGVSHVSIDAEPWICPITEPIEPMGCFDVKGIVDTAKFEREALIDGLKVILELMQSNPLTAQIVIYRIIHPHQIKLIEKALGMGKHAIKRRLVRALRRWPKLSAFVSVRKRAIKKEVKK
jgi:hypothetical protein